MAPEPHTPPPTEPTVRNPAVHGLSTAAASRKESVADEEEERRRQLAWFRITGLPDLPRAVAERIRESASTGGPYWEWFMLWGSATAQSAWEPASAGNQLIEVMKGDGFRQMPHFALLEDAVLHLSGAGADSHGAPGDLVAPGAGVTRYARPALDLFRRDSELTGWVKDVVDQAHTQVAAKARHLFGDSGVVLYRRAPLDSQGAVVRFPLESWSLSRSFATGWSTRATGGQSVLLTARVPPEAMWFTFARAEGEVAVSPTHERAGERLRPGGL